MSDVLLGGGEAFFENLFFILSASVESLFENIKRGRHNEDAHLLWSQSMTQGLCTLPINVAYHNISFFNGLHDGFFERAIVITEHFRMLQQGIVMVQLLHLF